MRVEECHEIKEPGFYLARFYGNVGDPEILTAIKKESSSELYIVQQITGDTIDIDYWSVEYKLICED